jgi:hypothetical protein
MCRFESDRGYHFLDISFETEMLLLRVRSATMTQQEMFEASFRRPKNYFKLSGADQWAIDKKLGILDWDGSDLSPDQITRFHTHYD